LTSYLDASVLVSMWVEDSHSDRVTRWSAALSRPPIVSNWSITEFTSALGVRRRMGALSVEEQDSAELALAAWLSGDVDKVALDTSDFEHARRIMRDGLPTRAPDALHLAAARRLRAPIATLDLAMASAARQIGIGVEAF
jgi:predicted nucleic acid-binding protein